MEKPLHPAWNRYLQMLCIVHTKDEKGILTITDRMQREYPGNYVIKESYNPRRGTWDAMIVFDSESDESFFILQHGGV